MSESITLSRREFLAVSTASVIVTSTGGLQAQENGKPWYAVMRRCGQINFNERDPLTMDVNAWADYWGSLKVDAVLLNGGGIVAFYPTQAPWRHRSEFLGSRDPFTRAPTTKSVGARNVKCSAYRGEKKILQTGWHFALINPSIS